MYKRRDWNLFNEGARADESTDEDSDPDNDGVGALDDLSDDSDLSSGDDDDSGSDDDDDDDDDDDARGATDDDDDVDVSSSNACGAPRVGLVVVGR